MQRKPEIIRHLLVSQRDDEEPEALKSFPEKEVVYNAALLIKDGYIEGDVVKDEQGQYAGVAMLGLTSKGHDLLEKIENTIMTPPTPGIPTEITESLAKFKEDYRD